MNRTRLTPSDEAQAARLDALVERFARELAPTSECIFCLSEPGAGLARIIETDTPETLERFRALAHRELGWRAV
jgi:hypothetical protein